VSVVLSVRSIVSALQRTDGKSFRTVSVLLQIVVSESAKGYKSVIEALKLKEFEKECVVALPEGFVSALQPGHRVTTTDPVCDPVFFINCFQFN